MIDKIVQLLELFGKDIIEFINLDFQNIRYENLGLMAWFGTALAVAILIKIVLDIILKKPAYKGSGSGTRSRRGQGFWVRFANFTPKLSMLCAAAMVIIALGGPFTNEFQETEETIESRTRIILVDGSSSMKRFFVNNELRRAEVGHKIVMELLRMRMGKNDRSSYWLFASNPYLVQDFTTDDQLFYLQAYDAPWGVSSCDDLPFGRCARIRGGAGTEISVALDRLIRYIDDDEEAKEASEISLIIVTDAEVYGNPDTQLRELKARNVVPHVLYIAGNSSNVDEESGDVLPTEPPQGFVEQINRYGGKFFDVRNEASIYQANEELENSESDPVQIKKYNRKKELFQIFLSVALIFACFAIITSLFAEIFLTTYP